MAVSSRGRSTTELQVSRMWKEREMSPERTKVWIEPKHRTSATGNTRKVPVVYYISRNGHLDHPHFIEVTLSSNEGLYLRDVINRLNVLRGKGMASLYSWSSKRSYKNGYVWYDLSESDLVLPAHGQEYVLKGSELLDPSVLNPKLGMETSSSYRPVKPPELDSKSENDSDSPGITRRRTPSWSSIDLNEYKVYKAETITESTRTLAAAADASTQTDEKRRRKPPVKEETVELRIENGSTELSREEISPPPSESSPETLETLMKADKRLVICQTTSNNEVEGSNRKVAESLPNGKMKASAVLMQLISCGAISFKDCGPGPGPGPSLEKDQGLSLIGYYKARLPRGAGKSNPALEKEAGGCGREFGGFSGVKLEDKEYFSGSLIETKKEVAPALKRSSSYNEDRSSQLQIEETEMDGARSKCIPRKPPPKKEVNAAAICTENGSNSGSRRGSKRYEI